MEWNKTKALKQQKRRRTLIVLAALAVVLLVAGLAVRGWIRMPDVPDPSAPLPLPGQSESESGKKPAGERKEGVYTFLVAGKDVASGSTDTMLLLTYDTKAKTIVGLNLPRDTMMNVTTNSKRLNAVFTYNKGTDKATQVEKGMTALKSAVCDLTGIVPDFYVLVEWEAIGELVDAIGGVEFEVPFDMDYDDPYQDPPLHIHQKAGKRTLNGDDAMQVIRWRKNNDGSGGEGGDIARLGIQQDFLKSVVKQCLKPATLLKLSSLVEIFKNNVETDLTVGNILAFAEHAIGMDPTTGVQFHTAPLADSFKYNKAALVTLDPEGVLAIINEKMNPYHGDITVDELEMVIRKADGTFTVTSGTIAENINQFANKSEKPKPEPAPEPEPVPEEPVEGETPAEGEEPIEGEAPVEGEPPAEGEAPGEPPVEGEIPAEPEVPSEEETPAVEPEPTPEPEPAPEVSEQPEIPAEPAPEEAPEQPAA